MLFCDTNRELLIIYYMSTYLSIFVELFLNHVLKMSAHAHVLTHAQKGWRSSSSGVQIGH